MNELQLNRSSSHHMAASRNCNIVVVTKNHLRFVIDRHIACILSSVLTAVAYGAQRPLTVVTCRRRRSTASERVRTRETVSKVWH